MNFFFLLDPFFGEGLLAGPPIPKSPIIGPPAILGPIFFIILEAWAKRARREFTSLTFVPDPFAILERLEPLMISGFAFSWGVMEEMMAVILSSLLSSMSSIWFLYWFMLGSIMSIFFKEPILRICSKELTKSSRPKLPAFIFFATSSPLFSSNSLSARSIRVRVSPMSRILLAMRSGWKTSKSLSLSPSEAKRMGFPVIPVTERAAPPLASPSSFVRTIPVKPTPLSKASATRTASWPIMESTTKRTSLAFTAFFICDASFIRESSTARRPAVSIITTS